MEFSGFGVGGAGHPRKPFVHLVEVLDGDGRHRLGLILDRDAFPALDGLVQTVRPLSTDHLSTGVLVDDDDSRFAVLILGDDVITVSLVDGMCSDRLLEKVRHVDVLTDVERADVRFSLSFGDSFIGDRRLLLVQLDLVVLGETISFRFEPGEFLSPGVQLVLQAGNE